MGTLTPVHLTTTEQRVLVGLVAGAVPPGDRLNVPADPDQVTQEVGLILASMPSFERMGVRLLFFLFEWIAVFVHGRRFSRLEPMVSAALVRRMAESPRSWIRLFARLLLTVVKPAHFARRAAQIQLGHPVDRLVDVKPNPEPVWAEDRIFEDLQADMDIRCQVAVIGSGAGGGVVAAELAERGIDVVIIEAGDRVNASMMVKSFREFLSRCGRSRRRVSPIQKSCGAAPCLGI